MDSFYPYYLCEHVQPATKLFHFIATFNAHSLLGRSLVGEWQWAGIGLAFLQVGWECVYGDKTSNLVIIYIKLVSSHWAKLLRKVFYQMKVFLGALM